MKKLLSILQLLSIISVYSVNSEEVGLNSKVIISSQSIQYNQSPILISFLFPINKNLTEIYLNPNIAIDIIKIEVDGKLLKRDVVLSFPMYMDKAIVVVNQDFHIYNIELSDSDGFYEIVHYAVDSGDYKYRFPKSWSKMTVDYRIVLPNGSMTNENQLQINRW